MAKSAYERALAKRTIVFGPPGVEGDCWLWTGKGKGQPHSEDPDNDHGKIRVKKNGVWTWDFVHRVSYVEHFGPIPDGMVVRHRCDRRRCFAPHHLIIGTQQQNWRDAVERGRARPFICNTTARAPEGRAINTEESSP